MRRILRALVEFPPVAAITRAVENHPRLAAWLVLSMGTCLVLAISGLNASVPLRPWLVIFAVGILTAGLCIKIVTGDDEADEGST